MKFRAAKSKIVSSNCSSSNQLPILATNIRIKTEASINKSNGKIIFGQKTINTNSNQLKMIYKELKSSTNQNHPKKEDSNCEKENKVIFPSILGNSSSHSNFAVQVKNKLNIIKAYQPKVRM